MNGSSQWTRRVAAAVPTSSASPERLGSSERTIVRAGMATAREPPTLAGAGAMTGRLTQREERHAPPPRLPARSALRYAERMLKLQGAFTALVTPFKPNLDVDDAALEKLVDAQLAGGICGLVPCGTTGESPTLDHEEHVGVITKVVKRAAGKVPVIAGCGSNSTREAIAMSKRAVDAGADAVMHVMPYYNKPTQQGLVDHVRVIAEAIPKTPIVLYNIPGRTGIDLFADAVEIICKSCSNVVAIKEATGNILRAQELVRRLGDRLTVLSGDDSLTLGMMACGARGVISVTSNLLPREVQNVCALMLAGKVEDARRAHLALVPVHDAMFIKSNPSPVKAALSDAGAMGLHVRPPLAIATEPTRGKIRDVVASFRAAIHTGHEQRPGNDGGGR